MTRVIAIDGPAGSGKSTTARAVAEAIGFAHLDSGALYRAVTLAGLDSHVGIGAAELVAAARKADVGLQWTGEEFVPVVAGRMVARAIRTDRVTGAVSAIAALPEVRDFVNTALRAAAAAHPDGVVLDGRDIGTVVFPDAVLKVFLTAAPEERGRRRAAELGLTDAAEVRRLWDEIDARDSHDSEREVAPLRPAADAIRVDTTGMGFQAQVREVVALARKALSGGPV